jgi:amino-acid N-acetyltransferase
VLQPESKTTLAAPGVRPAAIGDVPEIHHLIEIYAAAGNLLPRSMNELYRHLRDFFVVEVATGPTHTAGRTSDASRASDSDRDPRLGPIGEVNRRVVACGALEIFTESLGEIRSLVVADAFKSQGLGKLLVLRLIEEASAIGLKRLMALTYVPDFFHKIGFVTVPKETLPEKVWSVCVKCYKYNHCDEIAVLLELK